MVSSWQSEPLHQLWLNLRSNMGHTNIVVLGFHFTQMLSSLHICPVTPVVSQTTPTNCDSCYSYPSSPVPGSQVQSQVLKSHLNFSPRFSSVVSSSVPRSTVLSQFQSQVLKSRLNFSPRFSNLVSISVPRSRVSSQFQSQVLKSCLKFSPGSQV